ncbi:hypothetical protein Tco_0851728 [Tanacetum coccineum]
MAREAIPKKQRVLNTGNRVAKPVWTNDDRINHANQFVPRPVTLNAGRPNINSVRPNINTGRTILDSQYLPRPQTALVLKDLRPIVRNTARMTYSHAVKGNWGTAVKTSAGKEKVLNSPCFMVKSWLVQDQTVLGKDYSNLLIADSLLKTIWFINAPCYGNEALASPKANGVSYALSWKPCQGDSLNLPDHRSRRWDLPNVDMKEILQQRMFEDNSYKAQDVYNDLYEALQKSLELDYSNQRLADQEEACKKRRKRRDVPRTPSGSPPSQPPRPPPLAGVSGAPGTSGASGFSQLLLPPPHPSTGTSGSAQQQGTGVSRAQELSPTDSLIQDDSIPDEQVHLSDDEDSRNDHLPKADSRKDWWKPLPEEERPATPEPAGIIPSSNVLAIENNWASMLVSTYEPPNENSLLAKTRDMMTFMNWYCRQVNKTELTQADFKGQAYEVVKAFYLDVIHLHSNGELSPMLNIRFD